MGVVTTTIRPMTPEDVPPVVELETAHQPRPWSAGVFHDELAAENRVYLVASQDRIIGFAGMMVVGEEGHVTNLLVDPTCRRRGIARRLLRALISSAVERGARHLTLEVRKNNHAARALYASFAMAPVGIRPGYYGDDDALIFWAHDIDGAEYFETLR
jgi:ribosomal-protein-alanine N-acetyltransferase